MIQRAKGHLIVNVVAMIVMLATSCMVRSAWAAPRAVNMEECKNISQVALVARAAAESQIPAEQTSKLLASVFTTTGPRTVELIRLIQQAAYRSTDPALEFATGLGYTCASNGGDMDEILKEGI